MNDQKIKMIFNNLSNSKFRSKFHLSEKDIDYINTKGIDTIERHALDFVKNRLSHKVVLNDGKQTPMRGHPVFIAQHATATCCRGCLEKWHKIKKDKELTIEEQKYIVEVIMHWIKEKYNNSNI